MGSSCLPLFRYNTHYLILHVYTQSKILKAQISLGCHKLTTCRCTCASFPCLYTILRISLCSVQVWNGAGLSATFSSLGHTHDSTPPHPGTVYDVLPSSGNVSHDEDHTHSLSEIWGKWSEWSDPHTPIVEYFWAIGTTESANDVQDFLSVGVASGNYTFLSIKDTSIFL